MNDRQHSVLSLFYDEGHSEITPSFLAYRMRMSTAEASKLLDELVTQDVLDLHVDDEGHLIYSLPASEASRIGKGARPSQPQPAPHHQPQTQAQRQGQPSPQRSAAQQQTQRPATGGWQAASTPPGDGTDGSVASPYPPTQTPSTDHHQPTGHQPPPQQAPYDPRANPHRPQQPSRGHQPQAQVRPQQSQPHQPPARAPQHRRPMPDSQALTPYQSQHRPPSRPGRYEPTDGRVPVLAGALSLLVPGLGQFYNGEIGKGVMLLFSALLLSIFLLFWVVWIWSIIDAYMVAERSNQDRALPDQSPSQRPMLPPHSHSNSNAA